MNICVWVHALGCSSSIESMETIKKVGGGPAFTEAVLEVHACMGPLLLTHGGYNILPQREVVSL